MEIDVMIDRDWVGRKPSSASVLRDVVVGA
jgi:hypothetical protein